MLVSAVDHHVPDVADLIDPFRFIPNWRIDDVMVSYASDGGGVGPHFDQYDVFLIQGLGRRRWQTGALCNAQTALMPHDDLRLLAQFEALEDWVLGPGDILYVPPGYAHNGVAVGSDCMTYSIGFRAPSRGELIAHYCDHLLAEIDDDDRYGDAGLIVQTSPGEIAPEALARLRGMIIEKLGDPAAFGRWFGADCTVPKNPDIDWRPDLPYVLHDLREAGANRKTLMRNPASRFAFIRNGVDEILLFVDGETFECRGGDAHFAGQLCAQTALTVDEAMLSSVSVDLILKLLNQGSVALSADEG